MVSFLLALCPCAQQTKVRRVRMSNDFCLIMEWMGWLRVWLFPEVFLQSGYISHFF